MLILNFSHPFTKAQQMEIEEISDMNIENINNILVKLDLEEPLSPQISAIIDAIEISSEEWQTQPFLVNLPGYVPAALLLLAELHGRLGHFPTIIHSTRKQGKSMSYKIVELINLQAVREIARTKR